MPDVLVKGPMSYAGNEGLSDILFIYDLIISMNM